MTHTYEISGDDFVAYQTKRIADLWGSSRPRPSNRRMGFKDHWESERPPEDGRARRGARWENGRIN